MQERRPEKNEALTAATGRASSDVSQTTMKGTIVANSTELQAEGQMVVGDVVVRQIDGMYSLNDLHRASGGEKRHAPNEWARTQQAQDLVQEVSKPGIPGLVVQKGGSAPGTYACRELVVAFAAWISAAFHLKVIRVFLDVVTPRAPKEGADQVEGAMMEMLLEQRMLVSFDHVTRRMVSRLVPGDASVISLGKDDFDALIQRVPMARLPELADALNKRMSCHLAAFAEKLEAGRTERKPEAEQITVATVAAAIKQARAQGVTSIEGLARELGVHASTAKKLLGTLTMRGALG